MRAVWVLTAIVIAALAVTGCQNTAKAPENGGGNGNAEAPKKAGTPPAEVEVKIPSAGFDKGDYVTLLHDGRVWVFAKGSDDLKSFLAGNEPAKNVSMARQCRSAAARS